MTLWSFWLAPLLGFITSICLFIGGTDAALAAMSIDLGSEFIKIGLVKPGVPMEIVLNKESRRKTPNVLVIRNNERLFAEAAAAVAAKYPNSAYWYILSLLAKERGDPNVELYRTRFPFTSFTFDEVRNTVLFPSDSEVYNVETLLAMILWSAKKTTESFAGQRVKDVVITVPIFFNQAERRALIAAANIAGLNLLQLINDGSAAALNYGVFRRKEITDKPQTMMIYDMGASKTIATVVEYVLEKDKSSKIANISNPVVRTIGVGFDRFLGGFEITIRLAKHLEKVFRETVKTTNDITTNARSMAKLLKEAERVKQVLSANKYHYAQVESLHEDQNFKAKITREELEEMIGDMEPRVTQPIKDALAMAGKSIEEIDQFVLMGAGTRVPKVLDFLKTVLKDKEIGRFLNTDEAIALGAVYQAAELSKSFKVLPFGVKELIIYPVQVKFLSKTEDGGLKEATRQVFSHKSYYPTSNKIVTFQSYTDDFEISLGYDTLDHLNVDQRRHFKRTDLAQVSVQGLAITVKNNASCAECEMKGVKTTFSIDLSGIVSVLKSEFVMEKKPSAEEIAAYQEALQQYQEAEKMRREKEEIEKNAERKGKEDSHEDGDNIEKQNAANDSVSLPSAENADNTVSAPLDSQHSTESVRKDDIAKELENKAVLREPTEPKSKTLKIKLNTTVTFKDVKDLTSEQLESARIILENFENAENAKHRREEAMNSLEALVYDLAIKIEDGEEFAEYLTSEEKVQIAEELKRLRSWMEDEADMNTSADEFVSKKEILDKLTASGHSRKNERLMLPKAIESLTNLLNHSSAFYDVVLNMTTSDDPVFTTTELEVFSKLINSTTEWWKEKNASYVQQHKHEDLVMTTEDIAAKIMDLDREMKYLLNKMRIFKPKKKDELKKSLDSNDTDDASATATNGSAQVDDGINGGKTSNETEVEDGLSGKGQEHDPSEL
ncbi:hypothetical protein KIN20_009916 [Parelaphostrongylus tenuis]|uniref:Hypoxia up-regulated protein 1 n=1 Tax=Parelaphostrongylus tenuis TaxID=148309 RepID=A0AAD5MSJ0_PARTN|nr:hypothetical protein KIN20_009916 [Parelaphostrongylus tenuis]